MGLPAGTAWCGRGVPSGRPPFTNPVKYNNIAAYKTGRDGMKARIIFLALSAAVIVGAFALAGREDAGVAGDRAE